MSDNRKSRVTSCRIYRPSDFDCPNELNLPTPENAYAAYNLKIAGEKNLSRVNENFIALNNTDVRAFEKLMDVGLTESRPRRLKGGKKEIIEAILFQLRTYPKSGLKRTIYLAYFRLPV